MKKLSITRKVSYALIAVTTIIIGAFGAFNYITAAQSSHQRLVLGAQNVALRVAVNSALPLWNVDAKQAGEVILAEMTWPDVFAVTIEEKNGEEFKFFQGSQRDATWKSMPAQPKIEGRYITHTLDIKKDDKVIGRVQVYLSDRFLREELNRLLITSLLQAVLVGGSIILALQIIMRHSLVQPLQKVISALSDSSDELTRASVDLTHSGIILSAGANEQAAAVEEITSSLEELSSMTRTNNDNAAKGKGLADASRLSVDGGVKEMKEMSDSMDNAQQSTDELKKQMAEMKIASDGISRIIKTINEIAFQTNILALNASVEAARAGQAGLGFAVVADEVRNLAQRAANAARETEEKIAFSIRTSQEGARISDKVAENLQAVIVRVKAVDQHLLEIATKATDVDLTMGQIAEASQEQTQGISLITKSIHHTDSATQTGAAQAEETASCAEEISSQAKALNKSVSDLLALIGKPMIKSVTQHPGVSSEANATLQENMRRLTQRLSTQKISVPQRSTRPSNYSLKNGR